MSGEHSGKSLTYRDAGVDIDAGDELVERIKPGLAVEGRLEPAFAIRQQRFVAVRQDRGGD